MSDYDEWIWIRYSFSDSSFKFDYGFQVCPVEPLVPVFPGHAVSDQVGVKPPKASWYEGPQDKPPKPWQPGDSQ